MYLQSVTVNYFYIFPTWKGHAINKELRSFIKFYNIVLTETECSTLKCHRERISRIMVTQ